MTKAEIVIAAAKAQLGSPYVYGAWGNVCTPALRKKYAGYNPEHAPAIYRNCQALKGTSEDCEGCKYEGMLAFDCRGFTHWCLMQAEIDIAGSGATSQYNTASNWSERGDISEMPDVVCCVFKRNGKTMQHTGLHIGNGVIIHCSVGVQYGKITDSGWTDYAVPAGLYDDEGGIHGVVILKKGSRGDAVKDLQETLNKLGFSCGEADGVFGMRTESAVKLFQAAHFLTEDGIAGQQTQMALKLAATQAELPAQAPADEQAQGILWQYVQAAREALNRAEKAIAETKEALNALGEENE